MALKKKSDGKSIMAAGKKDASTISGDNSLVISDHYQNILNIED